MPICPPSPRRALAAVAVVLACSLAAGPVAAQGTAPPDPVGGTVTVYTSVTQDTVDAVLAALETVAPGLDVAVFRAPTGELDARIATELRTGGLDADLLWLSDPLSMQRYEDAGLLAPLEGDAFDVVPAAYRGDTFVGTRLLNLVLVAHDGAATVPGSWAALADPDAAGRVALPDPRFAGSAFAALGYLGTAENLGMDLYRALRTNGAVQLPSPVDTLTGVAEGNYDVGITLDKVARDNIARGAPIRMIWPEPGAIAVFSPAAVVAGSPDMAAARALLEFLVSAEAQAAIAATGWQPVRDDVGWPHDDPAVMPDWGALYGSAERLLEDYDAIFGD